MDFDAAGNLYLSTGDDTNPFDSAGFTPIDERAGRNPAFDAQRTSANSNDLRGKVLRIKPSAAGGYTIPAGNMFAPGTARTRPEVYAMGFRNPFRMSVDKATGIVYLGDYGPDAGTADPNRGPAGNVEFARIDRPGFYGWPYCTARNDAYNDYTFPSGPSGAKFNCAGGPVNNSPNNTGITQLPPAVPAWLPYGGSGSPPEFTGGGLSPMGGPVYRYDPSNTSPVAFPEYYDGTYFAGEFGRRWIKNIKLDPAGEPLKINPFPWTGTQVMDMEFGPDGALYVLDYGTGWFNGDANSALYRIEYAREGRAPDREGVRHPDKWHRAADRGLLLGRHPRPGRRPVHLRLGLRQQRHHRLDGGEPELHVHHQRNPQPDADGPGHHRQDGHRERGRHRRQQRPGGHREHPVERADVHLRGRGAVLRHRHRRPGRRRSTAPGSR